MWCVFFFSKEKWVFKFNFYIFFLNSIILRTTGCTWKCRWTVFYRSSHLSPEHSSSCCWSSRPPAGQTMKICVVVQLHWSHMENWVSLSSPLVLTRTQRWLKLFLSNSIPRMFGHFNPRIKLFAHFNHICSSYFVWLASFTGVYENPSASAFSPGRGKFSTGAGSDVHPPRYGKCDYLLIVAVTAMPFCSS